jgi:hypothetical protein
MSDKKIESRINHPAPSYELPAETTYFMLGCGACKHSIAFEAPTGLEADVISQVVEDISPRRKTHQGITYADSNTVCQTNGKKCPSGIEIDATVTILAASGFLDSYLE